MARKEKIDGVIEAVRYLPDGQVDWVRAFLRRGPTFSDHVILPRHELVDKISAGRKIFIGKRIELQASTFHVSARVSLKKVNGELMLITGDANSQLMSGVDFLEGAR